eukprot:g44259.t1
MSVFARRWRQRGWVKSCTWPAGKEVAHLEPKSARIEIRRTRPKKNRVELRKDGTVLVGPEARAKGLVGPRQLRSGPIGSGASLVAYSAYHNSHVEVWSRRGALVVVELLPWPYDVGLTLLQNSSLRGLLSSSELTPSPLSLYVDFFVASTVGVVEGFCLVHVSSATGS